MFKHISKNGLILAAFALLTTSMIVATFLLTEDQIDQAKQRQLLSVLNQLIPSSMHTNEMHEDCIVLAPSELLGNQPQNAYRARKQANDMAVILETTAPDGYSGDIDLVVAVATDMTVLGARVISHKETPGLGDKIDLRVSDWILAFENVQYSEDNTKRWQVKKDGGQFDQFTGATITPRAVVRAIANAAEYVRVNQQSIFDTPSNCSAPVENAEVLDERI